MKKNKKPELNKISPNMLEVKDKKKNKKPELNKISPNTLKVKDTKKEKLKKLKQIDIKEVIDDKDIVKTSLGSITSVGSAEVKKAKKKKKKQKGEKKLSEPTISNPAPSLAADQNKELTEKDLAKIQKKKAKKLAQKLKKLQNKATFAKETKGNKEIKQQAIVAAKGQSTVVSSKDGNVKPKNKKKDKKLKESINNNASAPVSASRREMKEKKQKSKQKRQEEKDQQQRDPITEAATVFVGNLPINTKRVQLIKLFKEYGPVNNLRFRTAGGKVIFKHKVRKEAGTLNAYVVLKDAATAEKALALNGADFKGNHVRVTKAADSYSDADAKRTVFVGNLKYTATEEKLRDIFSSCGEIDYVRCLRDGENGCKGVAYVCFQSPEAVGLAMELNETSLDDRPIHVERYSVKKLGAKNARDEAERNSSKKTGAAKRVNDRDKKRKKQHNGTSNPKDSNEKMKKKSEYRGVKVDGGIKKKTTKKKITTQMQRLAKKIAPRSN